MRDENRERALGLLRGSLPDADWERLRESSSNLEIATVLLASGRGSRSELAVLLHSLIVPEVAELVDEYVAREHLILDVERVSAAVAARLLVSAYVGLPIDALRSNLRHFVSDCVEGVRTDPALSLHRLRSGQSDDARRDAIVADLINRLDRPARRLVWLVLVEKHAIEQVARITGVPLERVECSLTAFLERLAHATSLDGGEDDHVSQDEDDFWREMERGGGDDQST